MAVRGNGRRQARPARSRAAPRRSATSKAHVVPLGLQSGTAHRPATPVARRRVAQPPLHVLLETAWSSRRNAGGDSAGNPLQSGVSFTTAASVSDDFTVERSPAREHFVQHHAERPDVGAFVDRLAARLLGRHVGGRAEDHARRVIAAGLVSVGECIESSRPSLPRSGSSASPGRSRGPSRCRRRGP